MLNTVRHLDITIYGCPCCGMIWPLPITCCDPGLCICGDPECEETGKGHDAEMPLTEFRGVTLTPWDQLPDDGTSFHPSITKYMCCLAEDGVWDDLPGDGPIEHHVLHRAAWQVTFEDTSPVTVEPMNICHECAKRWFGVTN